MGRKNTLRCTEIRRKPVTDLRVFKVYCRGIGEPIEVIANRVDEGDILTFKICFESCAKFEESEEVVAMFKEWDYFVMAIVSAK